MIGQKVQTPLGEGTLEPGKFVVFNGAGVVVGYRQLVRFTLNDEVAKHLQEKNCITPRAEKSALFTFDTEDISHV